MIGWLFFAALYAICVAYVVGTNVASFSGTPIPWQWKWSFLGAPFVMLADLWDVRRDIVNALRRKA